MENFTELLSSGVSLDYLTVVKVVLQPRSTAFESSVNSEVSLVQQVGSEEALLSLFCQSPVQNSAHFMDEKKIDERQHKALAILTLITHEWSLWCASSL